MFTPGSARQNVPSAYSAASSGHADLGVLRRQVRDLESKIARLDRAQAGKAVTDTPVTEAVQTRGKRPEDMMTPEAEAARIEEGKRNAALAVDLLDAQLTSESIDPGWSRATEEQIRSQFTKLPGATIQRIECRASICRADIASSDDQAEVLLARTPTPTEGVTSGIALRFEAAQGQSRTTIFYGREGHSFPPLP
jgi:hypothetical protein